MKKAVVLLSGGLDSTTTLYYARKLGYECFCLILDYGQRHRREVARAKKIAGRGGFQYVVLKIKLPWGGSALLDPNIALPRKRRGRMDVIPSTYVPARNIIFLSYAASCAEAIKARAIFIGANAIDYSGYPDCRPEFFAAYQQALNQGLKKKGIRVYTPLIKKTKAEIVRLGADLHAPLEFSWSCYQGGPRPCGECDSCLLRAKGFREAGLKDPAV